MSSSPLADATGTAAHLTIANAFVSVVIPCRNEVAHIDACMKSLLSNSWPAHQMEIIVVDGDSDDGTTEVVRQIAEREARIKLIINPRRIVPISLNMGIKVSVGNVIMRVDAHCLYPHTYVESLVTHLVQSGADNTGAVCDTVSAVGTAKGRGIALAMSHPLGVGNSHFRIGVAEPRWVDTVPFGCYRRDVFERIGLFDEGLVRNQDDEFNHRLIRHGGRILLVPDVVVTYFARDTFQKLWRMMYQYGLFKPLVSRKIGKVTTIRQLAPALLVLGLVVGGLLAYLWPTMQPFYAFGILVYSALIAVAAARLAFSRERMAALAFAVAVPTMHLAYGSGYLRGIAHALVARPGLTASVAGSVTR